MKLVIGGDLNCCLDFPNWSVNNIVDFMKSYNLQTCNKYFNHANDYTYHHDALGHFSYIDYFLVSNKLSSHSLNVLDNEPNLSDHQSCNQVTKAKSQASLKVTVSKSQVKSQVARFKSQVKSQVTGSKSQVKSQVTEPNFKSLVKSHNYSITVECYSCFSFESNFSFS